jgi:succinoglycan biosynthesis transport protein ExoP
VTASGTDHTNRSAGLELARELWARRRQVALAAFAAAFAVVLSLTIWLPDLYRATVTVLVETQQVAEVFVHASVTSELDARLQRIQQEVTSRARLEDLIARLGLYPELRQKGLPLEAVVERMRKDLDLELEGVDQPSGARGQTIAFKISYVGRDPETVARVANVLAAFYVDENTKIRAGQAARTAEFLRAQLADVKRELDDQDRRANEFKLNHLGELPQQVEANLGSLERLNTQLRMNTETQIRAMDRRDRIESQLAALGNAAPIDQAASSHGAELAKLRRELTELRRQFSDVYPDVIRLKDQIASLERQDSENRAPAKAGVAPIDARMRLNESLDEVQRELVALKEEELGLRRSIATYEQRVDNVPKRQQELLTLSRDYESIKERYDTLLKRYEEAQLAESLEQGQKAEQLRILDAAIPPRSPAAPGRLRLLVAGLILSFLIAAGAVFAAEKVDTSFHTVDDLRSFVRGATLFSIPLIHTAGATRQRWRRIMVTTAAVVVGLGLIVASCRYIAIGNERIARLVSRGHV